MATATELPDADDLRRIGWHAVGSLATPMVPCGALAIIDGDGEVSRSGFGLTGATLDVAAVRRLLALRVARHPIDPSPSSDVPPVAIMSGL